MAGGKLPPRQKMINMMYLVLMALLALNVSKEILKSFHLIEVSFNKAGKNVDEKNNTLLTALADQSGNRADVKPYYERAKEVQKTTEKFVAYIDDLKKTLIESAGGRKEGDVEDPAWDDYNLELAQSDNMEKHANYFFKSPKDENAQKLEAEINGTRKKLLAFLKSDTVKGVRIEASVAKEIEARCDLKAELEDGDKYQSWAHKYMEHSPLAAVVTLLTKIQNDAKNTEAEVMNALAANIDKNKISFNTLEAKVIANSTAVLAGEEYKAEVLLVASNSEAENVYELEGIDDPLPVEAGKGIYTVTASGVGTKEWGGVIKVPTDTGTALFPFNAEYKVFQPLSSISADAMNVLYVGLDNPISVSLSGVDPSSITVSMTGGSIKKASGGGQYSVRVKGGRTAKITATGKTSEGKAVSNSKEFRILRVPKPEAKFGTIGSGTSSSGALRAQTIIRADLQGFVFEGVRYVVTEYAYAYVPRRGDSRFGRAAGQAVSPQLKSFVSGARRGDKIILDEIKAKGPDGVKTLNPVVINISR